MPERSKSKHLLLVLRFNILQSAIWASGSVEDYKFVAATTGEPVIATMVPEDSLDVPFFRPSVEGISAYQLWQIQKQKLRLRKEHLDHWEATASVTGNGRPVDAIISPAAAYAAPPHGYNRYFNLATVAAVL